MKKGVAYLSIILLLLLVLPIIMSEDLEVLESVDDKSKIDNAYDCLQSKVDDRGCASFSSQEKIFTLLALQECKSEVLDDSRSNECWPDADCNIKTTAQAILALDNVHSSTDDAVDWLLDQKTTPTELDWYLQIESPEQTICTITYSGSSYKVNIGEDKKISSGAGSCLSLSTGSWWLRVSPSCYGDEIKISCDKQFLTNLLFKKTTSSTIHVSEKTNAASAEGTTIEKVESFCFSESINCDYEGSLWAALVLNFLNEEISDYLPYLIAMTDENSKYLPEAFLYMLTDDFRNELLLKQKNNYWDESGDKFYDTSLALLAFQNEEPNEKTNSLNWLLEIQDDEGCWQGNIRNTGFILYSAWPRDIIANGDDGEIDCEDAGYYCMSGISCEGEILKGYDCAGVFKCCDTEKALEFCEGQGGKICNSNEDCMGGTEVEASDIEYGQECCVGGRCEEPEAESECELNFGTCESYECAEDEEEMGYDCLYGDTCCVKKSEVEAKSYWWIWLLLIFIILIILGIVFRDKFRPFWFRFKSKFGKSRPSGGRPGGIGGFSSTPLGRMQIRPMARRILPPQSQKRPVERKPLPRQITEKPKTELDDVLKKLRDMSK
ncbi:MAG: hypothetical protein KJ646_02495 [Nanoarchaeota archaeon]|nr:hypothetical protein [Nanoarchaeota archaeon]MBU4116217.1 hypothetical protein [Nanoarchaeota archaeon]